jgi:hypothetical protein
MRKLFRIIAMLCLLQTSSISLADNWKIKLPSGETVKVVARPEGKFKSYIMTVGNKPPLLLLKIYKTQEIIRKENYGFIPIQDINIANQIALFEIAINSSASGTGQGQCGAGTEKYLFMVSLLPTPTTTHRIPLESCGISLSLPDDGIRHQSAKDNKDDKEYISIIDGNLIIKYGYFPRLDGRMVATYSLTDEFFNLEITKEPD